MAEIKNMVWEETPIDVSAEANFIWSIANKLRGSYMPDKYGDVIIPMVVIRRFECTLAPTKQAVVDMYKKNPKYPVKAMCKLSGYDFYNTSEFTLKELCNDADHIAANFKSYIAGFSTNVIDILNELEMTKHIEKMDKDGCIYNVVKAFSELDLSPDTYDSIKMGYIFENLIGRFFQNVDAGQYYTGRDIIKLCVSLLMAEGCDDIFDENKIVTVCDQACGTGGMLSTAYTYIKHYNPSANVKLFGQEFMGTSYAVGLAEMLIKKQTADAFIHTDTLKEDCFPDVKMRFLLENPPFGTPWSGEHAKQGQEDAVKKEYAKGTSGRWGAGLPAGGDSQLLFMQSAIAKMDKEVGRAAIISNGSPLFTGGTASGESQIRRWLLESDLIEAIVQLPTDLFYNTGITTYIWVLSKNKRAERKGKIQLIDASANFAVDREELFRFLYATQPETMKALNKIYRSETEETIVSAINTEETKKRGSRLSVLKHGIEISNLHLDLMYSKPATTFNKELNALYEKNIFSVSEEVWASDKERIDIVIFLNGLAIMAFELKANTAGQNYHDAIYQFRTERDPKTRLFRFKAGALVCFAMDLEEVYMTTKLDGAATFFLPFNMGRGEGINTGAGNPILEDEYSVHYMWDSILQKDSIIEIITKFMFIEVKEKEDENTGKTKITETVIFPRFHQLDVLRKLLDNVRENRSSQNYLLQHSAGSGKTNEIAWLSHRLASLHDKDNKIIFDNIIICTDRVVVDRQLQQAVQALEHKSGFIKVMDDSCNSADLAIALSGNTKIVVTTIQKFPYIVDAVSGMAKKTFAVIIDEAHSSTAGKNMAAVTRVLSDGKLEEEAPDMEDVIADEISRNGKQPNVSMFAFTATPKPTTLQLFGKQNAKGQKEAFHIYSMKQAIEEGFILDVLANYVTYKTYYRINKEIQEDPEYQTNAAKRAIARFADLDDTNIGQRIEIIIEHFRTTVMQELDGQAKAMVVTASREAAVKYRQAFENYVQRKGYNNIHALVAFSGKVTVDGVEYTEPGMNGISEKNLPIEFDKDEYQVLLVADKYQTGFDQKKLCAMYILKKLHGVATVQTLSRLNRICPPYEKKTFVLDFANDYDSIIRDFAKFYTTTLLSNSITVASIYDMEAKLDGFYVLDPSDVEKFNSILYQGNITAKDKKTMEFLLQKAKRTIEQGRNSEEKDEIILTIRHFVRFYEFLIQVSCFEDVELHKKYNFASYLHSYLKMNSHGGGFNLNGKIKATGFAQKKEGEHKKAKVNPNPIVRLPVAEQIVLTPQKTERLSQIIAEINSRTGKSYDEDFTVKAMLQLRDIMMKSEDLKASAKNNTEKDFEFAYFDSVDDALIEGLSQNQDFFTLLLQNEEMKKEVLGIFAEEIYNKLREN